MCSISKFLFLYTNWNYICHFQDSKRKNGIDSGKLTELKYKLTFIIITWYYTSKWSGKGESFFYENQQWIIRPFVILPYNKNTKDPESFFFKIFTPFSFAGSISFSFKVYTAVIVAGSHDTRPDHFSSL